MAMQTVYFREREGMISNNPIAPQPNSWNFFGSLPLFSESLGGGCHGGETATAVKQQSVRDSDQVMNKQNITTQFTLSSGDGKSYGLKPQVRYSEQSSYFELGFAQPPMSCAKYPYMEQYYGVVSAHGTQIPGRVMLPLNMETEDGPIYVNAKQYHGIMRRRQSRAKAVLQNKVSHCRKQPYKHYSRHLHAMRRPRGSGGRFLNTKALNKDQRGSEAKNTNAAKNSQQSRSQNSEVVHPDTNETLTDGSNVLGSEVTSLDWFLGRSIHSLSGMVMPSKWVAGSMDDSHGYCNLKV